MQSKEQPDAFQNIQDYRTAVIFPQVLTTSIWKRCRDSHDWIVSRSGIHERHIAADNELTATWLCKPACVH